MRALTLRKIKRVKIKSFAILLNPEIEKRLIITLSILIISLSIAYGYFVKQTVLNVVLREETEEKIADLNSKVGALEVKYIELKNLIDLDFAYSLGYEEAGEVKFVSRKVLGKTLTLNNQ